MRITLSQAMGRPQDVGPVILKSMVVGSLISFFHAVLFTKAPASFSLCASSIEIGAMSGMVMGIGVVILMALIKRAESS